MDVRHIDTSATSGTSWLHRMSPVAKLLSFTLVLAAVILQFNLLVVASVTLVLSAVVAGTRLPARTAFGLAAYPAVFATVFALAAAPDIWAGLLFVTKAVTAALASVTLVLTTPYPQVFAPLQRLLPQVVGDSMLMTYRSLFLLADKFSNLQRAVRLRSGLSARHPLRAAQATVTSLGSLLLYAFDLSQREYDILYLRGYSTRLRISIPRSSSPLSDVALSAGAASVLAVALLWRFGAAALNPYSWLPLAAAAVALSATLAWRMRPR